MSWGVTYQMPTMTVEHDDNMIYVRLHDVDKYPEFEDKRCMLFWFDNGLDVQDYQAVMDFVAQHGLTDPVTFFASEFGCTTIEISGQVVDRMKLIRQNFSQFMTFDPPPFWLFMRLPAPR